MYEHHIKNMASSLVEVGLATDQEQVELVLSQYWANTKFATEKTKAGTLLQSHSRSDSERKKEKENTIARSSRPKPISELPTNFLYISHRHSLTRKWKRTDGVVSTMRGSRYPYLAPIRRGKNEYLESW